MNLEQVKSEWLKAVQAHTGLPQMDWQTKELPRIKTQKQLRNALAKDYAYWTAQGDMWDHWFYTKFGLIAKNLLDKYFTNN